MKSLIRLINGKPQFYVKLGEHKNTGKYELVCRGNMGKSISVGTYLSKLNASKQAFKLNTHKLGE